VLSSFLAKLHVPEFQRLTSVSLPLTWELLTDHSSGPVGHHSDDEY